MYTVTLFQDFAGGKQRRVAMADHILRAEPVIAVLTPYVLARSAHDAYCMARDYVGDKSGWLMRLYMFCVTIELGMKGAILANCTAAVKAELKSRKIGHDLSKLHDKFLEIFPRFSTKAT